MRQSFRTTIISDINLQHSLHLTLEGSLGAIKNGGLGPFSAVVAANADASTRLLALLTTAGSSGAGVGDVRPRSAVTSTAETHYQRVGQPAAVQGDEDERDEDEEEQSGDD